MDVSKLAGRTFIASSWNTGRVEVIGEDAIRIKWAHKDTDQDRTEFEAWALEIAGDPAAEVTRYIGNDQEKEQAALRDWQKKKQAVACVEHFSKEFPMPGTMSVLGREGDTKTIWNPDNPDEVAAAKATFDQLVGKKGYLAFTVKKDGEKGERITEFDPKLGKVILVPRMVGG
jgi:hypothetical protein